MTGIYKITSPSGRVYVGQSVNINRRFRHYKKHLCIMQTRLHASFVKHGVENHIFEIIEDCEISQLNERERYWQDYYKVITRTGLNCRLTSSLEKSGSLSEMTKQRIGSANKILRTGCSLSESHKNNISAAGLNRVQSQKWNSNISKGRKGIVFSEVHIQNLKTSHGKTVIDDATGKTYYSARNAAEILGLNWNTLMARLNGNCINNTTLRYLQV